MEFFIFFNFKLKNVSVPFLLRPLPSFFFFRVRSNSGQSEEKELVQRRKLCDNVEKWAELRTLLKCSGLSSFTLEFSKLTSKQIEIIFFRFEKIILVRTFFLL